MRLWHYEPKHLLDGTTDASHRGLALRFRVLPSVTRQPNLHEWLDVSREFCECLRSRALSSLPELDQQRYPTEDAPGSIILCGEPVDVVLDGVTEPA